MVIRHPPGNALQKLGHLSSPQGYHDPVYDPDGGQGTAVDVPAGQQQNPGVLMLVALVVLVVLMFGEE